MTHLRNRAYFARALATCAAAIAFLAAMVPAASAAGGPAPSGGGLSWQLVSTGGQTHFRGLSVVSRNVVWLGGYNGVVLRTVNGGRTWINASPAGATALQFRDIEAFSATRAVAMAAGTGTSSALYFTANGGRSWRLAYQNTNPSAFFDCMAFFNPRNGLVLSDPVNGKFRILSTRDGGRHWTVLPNAGMPPALSGEGGFAASGECLITRAHNAWFGSGGASVARIFHSRDGGLTWQVSDSPMVAGPTAGVFALAFRTPRTGVAVGGDFAAPTASTRVAALSRIGSPWFTPPSGPAGYRSGLTYLPGAQATLVAVGLTGSDVSYDGGLHWQTFDTGQFDTVSCAADGSCWASGDLGRVAILQGQ
ncbi:MAG TPA: oxidoreductase [Streptosporangiaceae bacterium]|nr:oxidoreductase [Streptosporangiaceae bacterium]